MNDSPRPTCYITGATGFIGSHLAELLRARGHAVRLLVRNRARLQAELQEGYEYIDGALSDPPEKLAEGMSGCDYVYHVAGLIGAVRRREFDAVNVEGTRAMIEAARLAGAASKRFLLVSSLAAFGPARSRDEPREEHHEPGPRTMYGKSKLEGERLAWELAGRHGMRLTVVRPPAVYGPRDRAIFEFFKYMARGIEVGFGREKRYLDLIHGRDLARGIMLAAESERAVGEAYFITDEGRHELREVMALMREVMRPARRVTFIAPVWVVKLVARVNDLLQRVTGRMMLPNSDKLGELLPPVWCCSGAKAREHFGFRPEIALRDGLRETADWYERAGWLTVRRKG